jgi:hypothetical protein
MPAAATTALSDAVTCRGDKREAQRGACEIFVGHCCQPAHARTNHA